MNQIIIYCKCGKIKAAYDKALINDPDCQKEIKFYKNKGYKVKFGTDYEVKNNFGCTCKNNTQ